MLCMLERQSATEVKTALAAKAAMASAARESDDVPLTSAQAHARSALRCAIFSYCCWAVNSVMICILHS